MDNNNNQSIESVFANDSDALSIEVIFNNNTGAPIPTLGGCCCCCTCAASTNETAQ